MEEGKKRISIKAKVGLIIGYLIGLITIPILALLLVQLILLLFISALDTWKAVAFIAQFPATFYIWMRWKQ